MRRTYGLDDESTKDVSAEKREEVTREVYRLFDTNHDGLIEKDEYVRSREVLPDFGVGAVLANGEGMDMAWARGGANARD